MNGYSKQKVTIAVPRASGVQGFLHAMKEVLSRHNVDSVVVNSSGQVDVVIWVKNRDENHEFGPMQTAIGFESLMPAELLSRITLQEVATEADVLPELLMTRLFQEVDVEGLFPALLVVQNLDTFGKWYRAVTRQPFRGNVFGCHVAEDQNIADDIAILFASALPVETDSTHYTIAFKISLHSTRLEQPKQESNELIIVD